VTKAFIVCLKYKCRLLNYILNKNCCDVFFGGAPWGGKISASFFAPASAQVLDSSLSLPKSKKSQQHLVLELFDFFLSRSPKPLE
jgi:hypothetical protein